MVTALSFALLLNSHGMAFDTRMNGGACLCHAVPGVCLTHTTQEFSPLGIPDYFQYVIAVDPETQEPLQGAVEVGCMFDSDDAAPDNAVLTPTQDPDNIL